MVDARKERIGPSSLAKVLQGVRHVTVVSGKRIKRFDLEKDGIRRSDLAAKMVGPTGNLRAPTLRRGKHLIVGFGEEPYQEFFR